MATDEDHEVTDLSVAPVVGPDDPRRFTDSGIEVQPLYTADDVGDGLEERLGEPGEYPFTRGPHREMYRKQLWTMRQYAGYASAKESNERYKYLLAHGSTGLSMAFDLPTQLGLDSDDPRCLGEVGRTGVAIDTLDDMRTAFDGIPLDEVSTSMTINAPASVLLLLYQLVGEEQGVEPARLRGTVQNDILKEYIARGNFIYPPVPSMRLTTDLFAYCAEHVPRWNTVSISGYHFREKGCSAVQEVAFTLANGMAYVQAAIDAGLEVDKFAPRLAFFFNGHNNVFQEVAKFRAARRLWAAAMRERFGATDPKAQMIRFHTQTGGVTLTAQQPVNNIVRVALQAFAAVSGGTQSLHTNGYDEALALPSERAAKIALRTQQIIAHESGAADTVDPFAGSYYVEALTDEIEQRAARADRADRRAGRLRAGDHVHQERDRGVRLRLPRALPDRAGHRRRRQQVRRGGRRGRGHPARRPGRRARAGRAAQGVQGRPRPGARRAAPGGAAGGLPRRREPAPADPAGAQGRLLAGRGLRRHARRLRGLPARVLRPSLHWEGTSRGGRRQESMEAKRTLVKSPPELWAELSELSALARHLGEFGEIRITRTEPETVVEWEGDLASGSVRLEPSGWGTKVTLTALPVMLDPPPPEPEPIPEPPPAPAPRGFFARLFRRPAPAPEPEPVAVAPPAAPEPLPAIEAATGAAVLANALDTLGAAHHRPFSR